jgi:hypothetical protein
VFNSQLYATVLWLGSLLFIALLNSTQDITLSAIVAGFCMFTVRLLAIYQKKIIDGLFEETITFFLRDKGKQYAIQHKLVEI